MSSDAKENLEEENQRLVRENKRLLRTIARHEDLIKRIKITADTKKQLYDIVKAERSRAELNMHLLLKNIRDFILFFDSDAILQYCSDSFLRAKGIASQSLVQGKCMSEILGDILSEDDIQEIKNLPHKFFVGNPACSLEMSLKADLNKSGDFCDYLIEVNILATEENTSEGFVMLFYDTTQIEAARLEAEQANAAKSDFLATISHEIRTPMNAVIGLTRMIEETDLDERQKDLIGRIKSSSSNLLDIINDLLDFSKIEAGKLDITNDYFDFLELLDGVKSLFTLMMKQKGLQFTCNFASDLPHVVYSDGKRVRQVLVNLLNNAYKYTPDGSVSFDVQKKPNGNLAFIVTDTGIGIKENESYKLFREFEQLDQVRNKHVTGTGLGLAITKRICDLMGGTIKVESVYGQGSTFSVELPLRFGLTSDLAQDEVASLRFTARAARVLIVDDVEVNLEITRHMLEPFAVQTEVALNGKQAVELVEREHFDLVLMDHMMPIMDGIEATRTIRQHEQEAVQASGDPDGHIAIIAQTANAISGVEEMFAKEGFDGFISKPVDANNLARALYKYLPKELIDQTMV